jgi:colanic acid biosynthesis glycosyl transferase WcaI
MNIFVLGMNFFPELTGISVYTTEMCEYLSKMGHNVTVFTAFPYYPEWEIQQKYKKRLFLTENYEGIIIKRSYIYVPSKITTKSRILHELSFIISALFNMFFSCKADIIIAISPPLGLGLVAYIISRIKRIPFIFHIQDLQPDTAIKLGMLKNKQIINLLYKIEKFIYIKAKKVSVISKKMADKVISKGIEKENIIFFPNWVDIEYIKPYSKINKFSRTEGIENKFVVLYSGNIGVKQGLDVVLEVADKTRDNEDIVYIVVGDGAYKEKLIKKCEELKLNNMFFSPVQPKEKYPYVLSSSDICVVPQRKAVTDVVMPSKIFGIMASGKPVIAGASTGSELYNMITDSTCGILVEPENSKQMLNAIMYMYNNPKIGEEYGRNGREYVIRHFSKEMVLTTFERKIIEIIRL